MHQTNVVRKKTPKKDDGRQIGHFLKYHHWLKALELLEYQLDRKKDNKSFLTLEMSHYEIQRKSFNGLKSEKYFNTTVANNLFYGLGREFAIVPYTIPKSNLGLRRYKFMTCPMRVLYYAVGIYLLELSKNYLQGNYRTRNRIRAGYGGNLQFNELGHIIKRPKPIPEPIYHVPHYEHFCEEVEKEKEGNTERKVVIRLDIQNYFDELSIPKLLDLLEARVDFSVKESLQFDEITYDQLVAFFEFVACGNSGIPQSDNNVISDFVGYLFLAFGDLYLDDELCTCKDTVQDHAIIRYVDDIYVSITLKEQDSDLRAQFNPLAVRISDCLHEELGLRLNPKTKIFRLKKKSDRDALTRNLKMISQDDDAEDRTIAHPALKIEHIFEQLEELKRFPLAPYFREHYQPECDQEQFNEENFKEGLKGVFDKNVRRLLVCPKYNYMDRLRKILLSSNGFDFELVNAYPTPIIILISKCSRLSKQFQEFLGQKKTFTSRDIHLALRYLCQTGFNNSKLINRLSQDPAMKRIMKIFKRKALPAKPLGYYELTKAQTLKLAESHVIEQIRLRVLSELKEEYSVALSHLFNEFHACCQILDNDAPKLLRDYKKNNVSAFLMVKNVPTETNDQVLNLFGRRDKGTVSHADPIARPVAKDEYEGYSFQVGKCLKHLLSQ